MEKNSEQGTTQTTTTQGANQSSGSNQTSPNTQPPIVIAQPSYEERGIGADRVVTKVIKSK